uniref:Capsid protein n=1 Tax=unidentified TaxID=32644 RepID=A0A6G9W268_9ZZZZ|nr:hypothetical protein [unidentified]
MPYYRAYKRPRATKKKYSVQQKAFGFDAAKDTTSLVEVVPATTTEGTRKVKNITVSATCGPPEAEAPLYWAIVYVPQGTTPGGLNIAAAATDSTSLYEPNQYVMNCGIADPSAGPIRFYTPLARNLNDGDRILLLIRHVGTQAMPVRTLIRYAIAY